MSCQDFAPPQPLYIEGMIRIGGYDEDFVEQPPKEYECPVCLLSMKDPHLTQCCGSHFCASCIRPITLGGQKCPMCNQEIGTVMLNKKAQRAIGDLKIFCPKKVQGCDWAGELRYKQSHLDQDCQFVFVHCRYDCGQQVLRVEYKQHLEDLCTRRPLEIQLASLTRMFNTKVKLLEEKVATNKNECRVLIHSLEEKLAQQMEENSRLKQHLGNQNIQLEEVNQALKYYEKKAIIGQEELQKTNDRITKLQTQQYVAMPVTRLEELPKTSQGEGGDNSTPDDQSLESVRSMVAEQTVAELNSSSTSYQHEQESLSGTYASSPGLPQLQEELDMLGVQMGLLRESHWKFKEQSARRLRAVTNELATQYQLMKDFHQTSYSVFPLVPTWEEGSDLTTYVPIPPFEFTMTSFNKHKNLKDQWFGPGFYTAPGGYKMCVRVDAYGAGDGKGTHVSVYVYLMKGEYDDKLCWPMRANVIVQILNWLEDQNHIQESVRFSDDAGGDVCSRVMTSLRAKVGRGRHQFIAHSVLFQTKAKNVQYIHDDCLRFRVERADVQGFQPEEILKAPVWERDPVVPCEFTLTQFTHHKLSNDSWYSPPFFTHHAGYKLCLRVDANGDGQGRQSHVSMYVSLMRGEYDGQLRWPFRGEVVVQLLNWIESKNHIEEKIRFNEQAGDQVCGQVKAGTRAKVGRGRNQFIAHSDMCYKEKENTQYLFEDCMRFRVKKVTV